MLHGNIENTQDGLHNRLELCLESEPASTDLAEDLILQFCQSTEFSDDELNEIGLAVRESVANAVIHGNGCQAHKKVLLKAELRDTAMVITVTDEGERFDPEAVPDPLVGDQLFKESGRGILMIKTLMDEVSMRRRDAAGMEICMTKNYSKSTHTERHKMSLKISSRNVDGVTVLDLSGRIVLGEASSLVRETLKDMAGRGEKKILLNLADVGYIDSSGLGSLVGGYTSVSNAGGQIKLVNLNTKVHDLLRVTKLITVFEVHTSESAAIKSFS